MAKISASTEHALSVIAHLAMAKDMSKNIEGMKGFYTFYQDQLSAGDKKIVERFGELCHQAYADLAKLMANEIGRDGQ